MNVLPAAGVSLLSPIHVALLRLLICIPADLRPRRFSCRGTSPPFLPRQINLNGDLELSIGQIFCERRTLSSMINGERLDE